MMDSSTKKMGGAMLALFVILVGFVNNGNAGITSSYVRSVYPAVDMPLEDPVFATPAGYNAPQQVHITQGDYDGQAVIVSWVTPDEPGSNTVRYGKSKGKYNLKAEGSEVKSFTYGDEYKSGYIHQCLLSNLEFDTKYYYKLGEGSSSREFWFETPPKIDPDTPYVFGIIGDLGQTYNSLTTLGHFMQSKGKAVMYLGDLSYADQYVDIKEYKNVGVRWDSWGRFVENSTAYIPWLWSVGNHEVDYIPEMGEVETFKNYVYRYPTPYTASNSTSPLWYSVRRVNTHIIVLNSYSPFIKYTPQYIWLKEELAKVNRTETPWLFVITHVPIYNSNEAHFMEGESMRVVFEQWFIDYKVDAVFSGHMHAYERSHRISNVQYKVSTGACYPVADESAPMYVTIGDGGNLEGLAANFSDPQPDYSAFREASYGHAMLEIKNRTHASYHWHRNQDGKNVRSDSVVLHNQYWASSTEVKKHKLIQKVTNKN